MSEEFNDIYISEAVDSKEYDYEGDMAKTQLVTIADAAEELHDLLEDDENMPEWCQNKITKAMDYLDTVRDYMISKDTEEEPGDENPNEEYELDEILDTPKAMQSYKNKAKASYSKAASSAAAKILRGKDKDGNRADHRPELKTMAKRKKGMTGADMVAVRRTFDNLRKEETQNEGNMLSAAKELETYARKSGGIDKNDFMKAAMMMKRNQKKQLDKFVDELDTEPREKILSVMHKHIKEGAMKRIAQAQGGTKPDRSDAAINKGGLQTFKKKPTTEKLKVSDGIGAWIEDFYKSNAPQFKGKSREERRDMALAAYLSAKDSAKNEDI